MAAAFSSASDLCRSHDQTSCRHATVHAQRLSAPAARDLASHWHRSRRSASTALVAATSADGNAADAHRSPAQGTGPAASRAAASSRQQRRDSESPDSQLPNLPKRQRGGKSANLKKADIYGGQYRLRGSTDWVEPWVTQTIPEERLPRWEGEQKAA
jgi:hypothetical protein